MDSIDFNVCNKVMATHTHTHTQYTRIDNNKSIKSGLQHQYAGLPSMSRSMSMCASGSK